MGKHSQRRRFMVPVRPIALSLACLLTLGVGGMVAAGSMSDGQAVAASTSTRPEESPASRNKSRHGLVTVDDNGVKKLVSGTESMSVKSILDGAGIVLSPDDVVSPGLSDTLPAEGVITISSPNVTVETGTEPIPYNTIRKETSTLPKGTERVQTKGREGMMEATKLVTRVNGQVTGENVLTRQVTTPPVDEVVLVGSMETQKLGTTVPVGEMQQWAHDYLLSNGGMEEDFTATVQLIGKESGWRVDASNPSGAYGLPQALPGSKMASAGADWATNYQTQLKWFWNYCNGRYGGVRQAWAHWLAVRSY